MILCFIFFSFVSFATTTSTPCNFTAAVNLTIPTGSVLTRLPDYEGYQWAILYGRSDPVFGCDYGSADVMSYDPDTSKMTLVTATSNYCHTTDLLIITPFSGDTLAIRTSLSKTDHCDGAYFLLYLFKMEHLSNGDTACCSPFTADSFINPQIEQTQAPRIYQQDIIEPQRCD